MKQALRAIRSSFLLLALFSVLLGGVYPLMVTALAQIAFHHKANGSLIEGGEKIIGSRLLGQEFSEAKYFWGRLSATTPAYNAAASSGSNLSPANPKLLEAVNARLAALKKADPRNKLPVPVDLVTASGSGLDPHISVEAARYQLPRVARARHLSEQKIAALIEEHTSDADFGVLGAPYVNVLTLNHALDALAQ